MIRERLAGSRIAITGATGFLGTALVERLVRAVPDAELVLLVRPGRRGALRRVEREILRNDVFGRLRGELGDDGLREAWDARVRAVEADMSADGLGLDEQGRELLAGCDVFIHSAAHVSFELPIDTAVDVNLCGPIRLIETLAELGAAPHLVAVSTCYVAGSRKGDAPERPLTEDRFHINIDWRDEVAWARRTRMQVEDESREPERLAEFDTRSHQELGAAGIAALSAKTEQLRERWVKERMVTFGRSRARSLGFPDAYSFTKAMAEDAMFELRGDLPISIVRPSIIESSWSEPVPGWIRGFRMAEPVIIGYGRGLLREFPGVPEGIVDVIPVDLVVAAIIATAAAGPTDPPRIVQVASGSVNPFRLGDMLDWGYVWFGENPVYDERDQPIRPPDWALPGRGRVRRQLDRAKRGLHAAERVLHKLPLRGRPAMLAADLEERRENVERALGYVDIYSEYVESEAVFGVDRLLELWDSLPDGDQRDFGFDPRVIDWKHYTTEIHFPSVVTDGRVKTAPSTRRGPGRHERLRRQVLSPDRHLAAFDLENTLIASNVVASWGWLATRRLPAEERLRLVGRTLVEAPNLWLLDRRDRSDFLRHFYRRYAGAPVEQITEDALELFSDLILARSFPAGIRRVREHRAAGHRTVLITGALDFVVEPLRPLFDDIVCAHMSTTGATHEPAYTGHMLLAPPTGETRVEALRAYAESQGLSMSESVVYADSTSDLPLLESVGFPVAVNPETKLATLARRRGWLVENWSRADGAPSKLLPMEAK